MRYWRHYPKFLQLILLMLMIITLASFSTVVAGSLLKPLFGIGIEDVKNINASSNKTVIAATLFFQGISSLFTFLLSALLFAHLAHPKPFQYLGLRAPGKNMQAAIVLLVFASFIPIANQIGFWMQQIDFGAGAKAQFAHNEMITKTLLSGTSIQDLFIHLLIFALLPALGEELLFRGVIMRFSYNNSKNIHLAIILSAAIFGIAHGSAYNFFPIMLMGIVLGYIYYLTGSLWLSILAHFLNNALSTLSLFYHNKQSIAQQASNLEQFPWYVLIVCAAVFVLLFSLLRKNATPLPADWADDFKGERNSVI